MRVSIDQDKLKTEITKRRYQENDYFISIEEALQHGWRAEEQLICDLRKLVSKNAINWKVSDHRDTTHAFMGNIDWFKDSEQLYHTEKINQMLHKMLIGKTKKLHFSCFW